MLSGYRYCTNVADMFDVPRLFFSSSLNFSGYWASWFYFLVIRGDRDAEKVIVNTNKLIGVRLAETIKN